MIVSKPKLSKESQKYTIPPEEERDPDQAWYWTKEWQQGERRVDEHIARGEYETFDTIEEFLTSLDDEDE